MHRATPLPDELLSRPFRVSEALELGLTRKRLRSADLWMPYRGVRVPRALGWDPRLRARSGLLVCPPGTLVVGLDALAVAGLPLPISEEALLERRLAVCAPPSTDPFENDQLAVRWAAVSQLLPRVLDEGVLRLADTDLWLHEVLGGRHQLTAGYRARLGRAVVERVDGDQRVLRAAVDRLGSSTRARGQRLVDEALEGRETWLSA
ncbi:hypothetical protein [Quadrisphaera sp. INWT6]|uniref:hypothetical protein n=1 Tax=Quadrisphaera sp. INWT6 TaxID=2596917 RepID=UPI0018922AE2|nr:hypothetical protein [Quadrisphaera sp. INWT6]MBF5082494.1 hypothetical protein [Quadrisphaera sp. INWT6]